MRHVAFLRGINLGRRRVKMDVLRQHVEALGFTDVSTVLASGNVIFSARAARPASLEHRIEGHLEARLGYDVDTYVRTAPEVLAVAAREPFPAPDVAAAHAVHIVFLRETLDRAIARRLEACRTAVDRFHVEGREIHWLCRVPQVDSGVWGSPAVKALALPAGTMRTVTTVRRIAELLNVAGGVGR